MTTRYFTAAIIATMFAAAASAQSGTDLLQKGIYAQETLGDLDGAIRIYRQVTGLSTAPKPIAAQAQYQLVLCMLQKGDRSAATHELDLLTHNFPDQRDFIDKARKLIPGDSKLLPPPWEDGEASQLNIKRNGVLTGEYLYYAATPWRATADDYTRDPTHNRFAIDNAQAVYLDWRLVTNTSTRGSTIKVDRDTLRRMEPNGFFSTDDVGDTSAVPFAGPAIDAEPLVFRMRVLPLAAGYKTTLTTLPYLIGHGVPQTVEMSVIGVETVQTAAGKFSCYKVSFASLGQTFWIGVSGARPLVKFQSGNVEAELVKVWGPTVFDDALAFLKNAGWTVRNLVGGYLRTDEEATAFASSPANGPYGSPGTDIWMRRIYTPPAEIEKALQKECDGALQGSVQTRIVGSYHSISCNAGGFHIWVRTESLLLRFTQSGNATTPTFRWIFEPILDTIKLP